MKDVLWLCLLTRKSHIHLFVIKRCKNTDFLERLYDQK